MLPRQHASTLENPGAASRAVDPAAYSPYITEFTEAVASETMDGYIITMLNDDDFSLFVPADAPTATATATATATTATEDEAEVNSPYKPRKRRAAEEDAEDAEDAATPVRPRAQGNIMSPFGLSGGLFGGQPFASPSPNSKILFQQMEDCMHGVSTPLADKVAAMHADPNMRLEWSFIEPWTIGRLMQNETRESLVFDADAVFKQEPRIIVVKLTDVQALSLVFSLAEIRSKDVYAHVGFRSWLANFKKTGGKVNEGLTFRFLADAVAAHPTVLLPIDPSYDIYGANRATFAPMCDPARARMTGDLLLLESPASGVFAAAVVKGPALVNTLNRPGFNVFGRGGGGEDGKDTCPMLLPIQLLEVYAPAPHHVLANIPAFELPPNFHEIEHPANNAANNAALMSLVFSARSKDAKTPVALSALFGVTTKNAVPVGKARGSGSGSGSGSGGGGNGNGGNGNGNGKRHKNSSTSFTDQILNVAFENSLVRPNCAWVIEHCCRYSN